MLTSEATKNAAVNKDALGMLAWVKRSRLICLSEYQVTPPVRA